jgi:hypothetical protein
MMLLEGWLREPSVALPIHLGVLFVTAMVCHGELSRRRPPASRLTEFYLWISVGGVLGGIFNVLLAPVLFTRIYEYPLLLGLACLARPGRRRRRRRGCRATCCTRSRRWPTASRSSTWRTRTARDSPGSPSPRWRRW